MSETHFEGNSNAFAGEGSPAVTYSSLELAKALEQLRDAVETEGAFLVLAGEPGVGKSTAVRSLLADLPAARPCAVVRGAPKDPLALLEAIATGFEIEISDLRTKVRVSEALRTALIERTRVGGHALVIVEDAEQLPAAGFEELRALASLKRDGRRVVQFLLVGTPALTQRLDSLELWQLRQLVARSHTMGPFGAPSAPTSFRAPSVPTSSRAPSAPAPSRAPEPRAVERPEPYIGSTVVGHRLRSRKRFGGKALGWLAAPVVVLGVLALWPGRGYVAKLLPQGRMSFPIAKLLSTEEASPSRAHAPRSVAPRVSSPVPASEPASEPGAGADSLGQLALGAAAGAAGEPASVAPTEIPSLEPGNGEEAFSRAVAGPRTPSGPNARQQRFAIEVGSYATRALAEQALALGGEMNLTGTIAPGDGGAGPPFRILLGSFTSIDRARIAAEDLKRHGTFPSALVRPVSDPQTP